MNKTTVSQMSTLFVLSLLPYFISSCKCDKTQYLPLTLFWTSAYTKSLNLYILTRKKVFEMISFFSVALRWHFLRWHLLHLRKQYKTSARSRLPYFLIVWSFIDIHNKWKCKKLISCRLAITLSMHCHIKATHYLFWFYGNCN